jgi:Predicted integral membrane protein
VFDVPNWIVRLIVVLIVIGFPIALIFAWAVRDHSRRNQKHRRGRRHAAIVAAKQSHLDLHRCCRRRSLAVVIFPRSLHGRNRTMSSGDKKSIAVLPFASLSENKNDAYFADGVQDQI